jgi:hypothetical protein
VTSASRRRLSGAASSPPAGRDSTVRFGLGETLMMGSDTWQSEGIPRRDSMQELAESDFDSFMKKAAFAFDS